ncbi:MAG TPA: hypothetical protein VH542_08725, partial [Steroidobacteraceae bacterium]
RERPAVLGGMRVGRFVINQPREELHERIQRRFEAMMSAGLLDEVRALHRRGDLTSDKPAIRAVGYRQLWQHLEGTTSLDQAVHDGIVATRRLAKRQMTWLRALSQAEWLNSPTVAGERVLAWLADDAENE